MKIFNRNSRNAVAQCAFGALALLFAPASRASPVTYYFGGHLNMVDSGLETAFATADTFSGSFTYESTAVDSFGATDLGAYPAPAFSLTASGLSYSGTGPGYYLHVQHNGITRCCWRACLLSGELRGARCREVKKKVARPGGTNGAGCHIGLIPARTRRMTGAKCHITPSPSTGSGRTGFGSSSFGERSIVCAKGWAVRVRENQAHN